MPHVAAAYDAVIVGGGIIGSAIARALSDAGLTLALIEAHEPERQASTAAAGLLAPQFEEGGGPDPLFDACHRSRALYPDFATSLKDETGIDVELRRDGLIVMAFDREDEAELERRAAWQRAAGLPVERLTGDRVRELEPAAAPEARGGLLLPRDVQVNNGRLCRALDRSLDARRVARHRGDPVTAIELEGDRPAAVRLGSGARVAAERIVIAAGAWSGGIGGLPRTLPVRPIRGEMVELRRPPVAIRRILASRAGCYIVPRLDGRLLVGSTMEDAGFASHPTAGGVMDILSRAVRIAPRLRSARLSRTWAGLRPGTPDGLPILGPDPAAPGLLYATGHFRNGILLAPLTAQLIAELVTEGEARIDLQPFRPDRFG